MKQHNFIYKEGYFRILIFNNILVIFQFSIHANCAPIIVLKYNFKSKLKYVISQICSINTMSLEKDVLILTIIVITIITCPSDRISKIKEKTERFQIRTLAGTIFRNKFFTVF